ncbi:uncharacterized protein LOC133867423 [Alnus glutinosa]|uniref:uncharacterized protein LOC133867423 n=1 Tax=Alnus glutinosa TaxID=3517 RepID=UPI002D795DA5|nr:uncharacterized protein LOC133867423 [Alnus glutinosa]
MSTSTPILPFNGLPTGPSRSYRASARNPNHLLVISKGKIGSCFLGNGLEFVNTGLTVTDQLIVRKTKIYGVLPGAPLPSDPSPDSWKVWIFGIITTVILPLLGSKWGPLQTLKSRLETTADKVEAVAEAVENVAEQVDKLAEDVADHLPPGGKLKEAAALIEHLAEETAKGAHLVDKAIEQVEEIEKQVEEVQKQTVEVQKEVDSLMEPLTEQAKPTPKEANK